MGLERYVEAQESTYGTALAELRAGHKRSHWMWFVFPQLAGLGRSATAQRYGLTGAAEARAYAEHPVLGARLGECARALLELPGSDPVAVLGSVDALKLRSCMTLFAEVTTAEPVFARVLDKYYDGEPDALTLEILSSEQP